MGTRLIQLIQGDPRMTLGAAVDRPEHPKLGEDVGVVLGLGPLGVPLSCTLLETQPIDVVIDFSTPAASVALVSACRLRKIPVVVATTGFEPAQLEEIR